MIEQGTEQFLGIFLPAALIIVGLTIIRIRNLFAAAMLMAFFSLLAATYFVITDAVDVAFTEAAVGAGLSAVLMLGAISLTTREEKPGSNSPLMAAVVVISAAALLLYGTVDMPDYGTLDAPIHPEDAPAWRYIHQSEAEIGIPNIVTSVLASYRGYDTFGEVIVVFTAAMVVFLLLGSHRIRLEEHLEEEKDSHEKE